jgi:Protein of unknown function (DUF3017)
MRSEPLDTTADLVLVRDEAAPAQPATAAPTASPTSIQPMPIQPAPNDVTTPATRRPVSRRFVGEAPLALVICGVGVGLLVIALHHFRWGSLAISAAVLAGGVFRLILPARKAGLLVVRTRLTDVVTMGAIGGALMVLALVTRT